MGGREFPQLTSVLRTLAADPELPPPRPLRRVSLTVSNKVRTAVSEKVSSPSTTREPASAVVLARVASLSTKARGTGKNDRKQLRFPSIRRVYARARVDAQTGEIVRKGRSYYLDVWEYLQAWGMRTLNDLQGQGFGPPDHEDLAALFEKRVRQRGRTWSSYDGRGAGLSIETVEVMVEGAATATLRDWSEEWIVGRRESGRIRGSFSKRGPKWDADDLAILMLFEHLPASAGAHVFNRWRARSAVVSRATFYRMKAAARTLG